MTIGQKIQNFRKEKGYTQKQLAEKCGVATGTIQQYELNKREPRQEQLRKIADALEVELWEIVELDQMDIETRIQQIKKMVAQLTPEGLEEYNRLVTEAIKTAPRQIDPNTGQPLKEPTKFTDVSTTYAPQEAYELLHSLIDREGMDDREREEVSQHLKRILDSYKRLNEIGRKKAVERIEELYMIPKYVFDNFPDNID